MGSALDDRATLVLMYVPFSHEHRVYSNSDVKELFRERFSRNHKAIYVKVNEPYLNFSDSYV